VVSFARKRRIGLELEQLPAERGSGGNKGTDARGATSSEGRARGLGHGVLGPLTPRTPLLSNLAPSTGCYELAPRLVPTTSQTASDYSDPRSPASRACDASCA
jgi:hypothetical protein